MLFPIAAAATSKFAECFKLKICSDLMLHFVVLDFVVKHSILLSMYFGNSANTIDSVFKFRYNSNPHLVCETVFGISFLCVSKLHFEYNTIRNMCQALFCMFANLFWKDRKMNAKERVKDLCKQAGITAQKAESDCGLGGGFISRLDKSTPNAENIKKLADYFGVSADYLLGSDTDNDLMDLAKQSVANKVMLDLFVQLNERDKRLIISIMRDMVMEDEYKKANVQNGEVG